MNAYQQKWIEVLKNAHVPGWDINGSGDDIIIKVPDNKAIKELADNLEAVLAEMSLDITLPRERVKFIIRNAREEVDYILNPQERDLNTDKL